MTSLKTTIVVTVLLVVGYSVYQALYNPPGSSPKQPPAGDPAVDADAQRHPSPTTADQYPGRSTGKQAGRRLAGNRFATGSAPDPTTAATSDRNAAGHAVASEAPPWSDRASTSPPSNSDDPVARTVSNRTLPAAAASNRNASDRTAAAAGAAASGDNRNEAATTAKTVRGRTGWSFDPDAVSTRGRTESAPNNYADGRDDAPPGGRNDFDNDAARSRPADRRNAPSEASPKAAAPDEARPSFQAMIDRANRLIDEGQLAKVLRDLSPWFGRTDLLPAESDRVTDMLDQLAGAVIYSRQHLIVPAHLVQPNENLYQIAQKYLVPWQLLAKINDIRDPNQLAPGRKLKVVRGPFDATVYLQRRELVLSANGCYAGRFPIGVGRDQPKLEGIYVVRKKHTQKAYEGPGAVIEPGDPRNPLGRFYVELDDRIGLHGTNDPRAIGRSDGRGTVCLGDRDLEDVFDILTAESQAAPGSKVTILR